MYPLVADYLLFLAQTVTILVALCAIVVLIAMLAGHKQPETERLELKKINERLRDYKTTIESAILTKEQIRKQRKAQKKHDAQEAQAQREHPRPRVFVLTFDGDIKASGVAALAEEITAILTLATAQDEVVVKVYSPGGLVHAYGLAASQLRRLREHGIPLTVAIDKIAASGGYMMACVANHIIAAPFAIVGSVGVVAQIPNLHRLLKKHDIDIELHTAGKYKRTLTVLGENTKEGREKFQHDMEETHQLFRDFVTQHRPQIDAERIATGEYWHASQAMDIKLVDKLQTSDDYLMTKAQTADVLALSLTSRPSLGQRLTNMLTTVYERGSAYLHQSSNENRFG